MNFVTIGWRKVLLLSLKMMIIITMSVLHCPRSNSAKFAVARCQLLVIAPCHIPVLGSGLPLQLQIAVCLREDTICSHRQCPAGPDFAIAGALAHVFLVTQSPTLLCLGHKLITHSYYTFILPVTIAFRVTSCTNSNLLDLF